ncbi:MAG TPA: hypothetical protein VLB44_10745 [Kofleriaceae bacterium]|nr:hypothetical protein [Kofleriaceae bacterium]
MLRVCAAITMFLAGCETCGPPAEPLIDFVVTVEVPTSTGQYLHAAMYNSLGVYVTAVEADAAAMWSHTLGNCDGDPQQSGQFKIVAWLNTSFKFDEREPAAGDPQAMDLVDVNCGSDGCFATRDAHITIR